MWRALRWSVVILLLVAGVAWWQIDRLWSQRNLLLAGKIRERLSEIAPEWEIEFASAEFGEEGRVGLSDLRVRPKGAEGTLLVIPRLEVELDRELFANSLQVQILHVDVHEPLLQLVRSGAGEWNWQNLPPLPHSKQAAPEIEIHGGRVEVLLEASTHLPQTEFQLSEVSVTLSPSAWHQYRLAGATQLDETGTLQFRGTLDLESRAWTLHGRCDELGPPGQLLEIAAGLSPVARERLNHLALQTERARLSRNTRRGGEFHTHAVPVRTASQSAVQSVGGTPLSNARFRIPALGLAANVQIEFLLNGDTSGEPPGYHVQARIRDGVIDNPALPVPLSGVACDLTISPSQIVLTGFEASNGESRLTANATVSRDASAPARSLSIRAQNLQFGRQIEDHLSGGLLRMYQELRPAGRFDVDVSASTDGLSGWQVRLNQFEAHDCSILPDVFRCLVDGIQGRIWQEDRTFYVDFTGYAAGRPVTAKGYFANPGPNLTAVINVRGERLPIDERVIEGFNEPQHEGIREAIERLNVRGLCDLDLSLVKTGEPGETVVPRLTVDVYDATLTARNFAYRVEELSGRVRFDPLADDPAEREVCRFLDLKGRHGPARLSGSGAFLTDDAERRLELRLSALDVPVDQDLEFAIVHANPDLSSIFANVGRSGSVDLESIDVTWVPGGSPRIVLPSIVLRNGVLKLEQFPFVWERVMATLRWQPGRLEIASLSGWHGRSTYLQVESGESADAAVLEFPETGQVAWHLHLETIRVSALEAGQEFRKALPPAIRETVDALNPRGRMNLLVGLDLKGFRDGADRVTAAWTLEADLLGENALSPGVELSGLEGTIVIPYAVWDGQRNFLEGAFVFSKARAFDMPVTDLNGPFLIDGNDVFVGMPTWPELKAVPPYDRSINRLGGEQVQASLYGGQVGFDVHAQLPSTAGGEIQYRTEVNLRNVKLRQWARDHGLAGERLHGDVNARLDWLIGKGRSDRSLRGEGWIQISPAQLYELPVLNRVLSSLELRQPDTTAFRYAYGEFSIHDGLFDFSKIDLVGDSLRLVGRGTVAFGEGLNRRIAIDFYRSEFANRLPGLGFALGFLTRNSLGVKLRGTVDDPVAEVQAKLGVIDDALRNLLDNFNAGQRPGLPRPIPQEPQPRRPTLR